MVEIVLLRRKTVDLSLASNTPVHGPVQGESVIKCHQAASSIIKHHQALSSIIKCHQVSLSFIKCH